MKPIFSSNEDYNKTAFLNWRIKKGNDILNLLNMAEGFLRSSIQQARIALDNNEHKIADITIFPILTNANHGIELYLKALTWMLNVLTANNNRIEGKHNIKQIYDTVRSKIEKYDGEIDLKHFDEVTGSLKNYIDELFDTVQATDKKDKMDFSRYPFDTKYESHFYVSELVNVEIDLENFITRFGEILYNLETLTDFIFHQELNQEW
jgi:hypothetical protein